MHHLHPFFSKFPGGGPRTLTCRRGDIHSRIYTAKGKNSPASSISERSFEEKNYAKIQHAIGKNWTQNAPFAFIFFSKFPRGRPPDPHLREGVPPPPPSPAALHADLVTPPGSGPSGSAAEDKLKLRAPYNIFIIGLRN